MSLPPPQTREFIDRLTSLSAECREELEQGSQSLQEIAMLLKQTQSEVDRLSVRETQMNVRVRELESSLESFSRTEIRDTYQAAHDVQLRLFMMRNQHEQLDARREAIEAQHEKLRIMLNLAEINREHGTEILGEAKTRVLSNGRGAGDLFAEVAPELIFAQERERVRIARQLSDGPAQVLVNLILRTQIAEQVAERQPEALPDELNAMRDLASKSLLDVRRAIFEMRPLMLEELGLVGTLRRYAQDFARDNGATITINASERDDSGVDHTRVALFRLIQKALVALVAPGAGTQVQVHVRLEEAQLLVRIDATAIDKATPRNTERFMADEFTVESLELIGASIQRESLTNGLRVTINVPLNVM